ncbi:C-type natriuretic peptide 1-like [Pseudophryne corroboree]|uniref:C-type natriuretic peptide 1-like n=1 Tax=Pseudophryne corroboree TaxID=495146 RepID=UPI003081EC1D
MSYKRGASLGFLLILIFCQEQVRGKPMSSLQSLSRLLEDNFERSYGSEESDHERGEMVPTDSLDQPDPLSQWDGNRVDKLEGPHLSGMTLREILDDPAGTQRRYRQRSKKAFSRGCFGVKLDRIGSFSGLGC